LQTVGPAKRPLQPGVGPGTGRGPASPVPTRRHPPTSLDPPRTGRDRLSCLRRPSQHELPRTTDLNWKMGLLPGGMAVQPGLRSGLGDSALCLSRCTLRIQCSPEH
jgi:hypothetical protein